MSHKSSRNGTIISREQIINTETGEYYEYEQEKHYPKGIAILHNEEPFYKARLLLIKTIKPKEIGYLLKLIGKNIDYKTGMLRLGGRGKTPIPITQIKQIAKVLTMNRKTARTLVNYFLKELVLFVIDKAYYVNPIFVQYGKTIEPDILLKMIEQDIRIKQYLAKSSAKLLCDFNKVA